MMPWLFITLLAAAAVTSMISAILGMAGGMVLQAVLLMALPLTVVVPLHGAVQLSSNATRLLVYLKDMETRIVGRYCVGALLGGIGGWFFLEKVRPAPGTPAERVLEAAVGIIILATTFLPRPRLERRLGDNVFLFVGAAATCVGILVGAVGPFIAPFFVREGMFKERLIATKAACQAVTHVIKIPTFILWGFDFRPHAGLLAAMIAAVIVGTLIGRRLVKYVSPRIFVTAVKLFLVLAAVKLIVGPARNGAAGVSGIRRTDVSTRTTRPKKVVLAYSGGLDTSVILPWLRETYGCEVIAYGAELGQGDELKDIQRKALASGASKVIVRDLRREFVEDFLWPMLRSGAIYEQRYLLGTAIARPLIAKEQVRVAAEEGADAVAHGATGKGNDQVRFETTYLALNPKLKIIAPWKDPRFDLRSREAAVEYAHARNIPVEATKKSIYSRDRNMWHISHEGAELESTWAEPRDAMLVLSVPVEKAPNRPAYVEVGFTHGVPTHLDGKKTSGVKLIEQLNALGGKHAVGQTDLIENRLVGIKSRGVYETPAGTILYEAHRALESVCLDRETAHYKEQVALRYAELVYYGQWYGALREALDAFIDKTQQHVTGTVRIKLFKGAARTVGVKSNKSLYREDLASFTMGAEYDATDANGFIRLFALPTTVRGAIQGTSASFKKRRT